MLASYGYHDDSGFYFITIDTDECTDCKDHPCAATCPANVLEIITDDHQDQVCAVREEHRNQIRDSCAPCKAAGGQDSLPCTGACPYQALQHSW